MVKQPEGRRLEFKSVVPSGNDLVKTVISFANDAGGDLFIGIQDDPRKILGLEKGELIMIEERISNFIHDLCDPTIIPEINFLAEKGKHVVLIHIHKGSSPPYHMKSKGIVKGTFIRVGSANRLATEEIIEGLVRQKKKVSFDSETLFQVPLGKVDLASFEDLFKKRVGGALSFETLSKLNLISIEQGYQVLTNALILLSDAPLRSELFPNAKVECARFKGIIPGEFIDQKSIDVNVSLQAEQAYQFVLRHISQGSTDYTGVYRNDRWEYPIIAIREVIRNAVIHRDYSLRGKDIKIALFDDKIEITSPGKLMPSIDYNDMKSGQSDIRNTALAPVFKKLGIIEQWGNGLKLIAEDLQDYPEIKLSWSEPGIAFRVVFIKTDYGVKQELQQELQQESLLSRVLNLVLKEDLSRRSISIELGQKRISGQLNQTIKKLFVLGLVELTIKEIPQSPQQKIRITRNGKMFLDILKELKSQ